MADIFREVDEEVRREQLVRIWNRYGTLIIAAVVVVVAAVAGWRGYQYWQSQKAAELGAKMETALTLSEQNKHAEAEDAFARIVSEGTAAYRTLAQFQQAQEIARRDRQAAVAAYDAIASDSAATREMRDAAALRSAMLLLDTASLADMTARLEPQTDAAATFRHSARELLALSAYRHGDKQAASRWIQAILSDPATPQNIRTRTDVLRAVAGLNDKT